MSHARTRRSLSMAAPAAVVVDEEVSWELVGLTLDLRFLFLLFVSPSAFCTTSKLQHSLFDGNQGFLFAFNTFVFCLVVVAVQQARLIHFPLQPFFALRHHQLAAALLYFEDIHIVTVVSFQKSPFISTVPSTLQSSNQSWLRPRLLDFLLPSPASSF